MSSASVFAHQRSCELTIALITETFPAAGGEEAFLAQEVRCLSERFRLEVIPCRRPGSRWAELPPRVEVDESLSVHMSKFTSVVLGLCRALCRIQTFRELRSFGFRALDPRVLLTVLARGARWAQAEAWARRKTWNANDTLLYTWWATPTSFGASNAARQKGVTRVTRIHGFELYPEQDRLGKIPYQLSGLSTYSEIFAISEHGRTYLQGRYPQLGTIVRRSYLGVSPAPNLPLPSPDGLLRLLSCSSCDSIKRVHLIAESLLLLHQDHPDLKFSWTHIGDGVALDAIRARLQSVPALRDLCTFTGHVAHSSVREIMSGKRWDLFMNVSSSEGLPVSLMEAASSGIPLIATDVGGSAEIVKPAGGRMLPPDFLTQHLSEAIYELHLLSAAARSDLRHRARLAWQEKFSAERNYREFGTFLYELWQENQTQLRSEAEDDPLGF